MSRVNNTALKNNLTTRKWFKRGSFDILSTMGLILKGLLLLVIALIAWAFDKTSGLESANTSNISVLPGVIIAYARIKHFHGPRAQKQKGGDAECARP